jgi:Flp pilus assembly pilin Flp
MVNLFLKVKGLIEDAGVLDEKAQTLVEYGLILLLISITVILILTEVGDEVVALFQSVLDALPPGANKISSFMIA